MAKDFGTLPVAEPGSLLEPGLRFEDLSRRTQISQLRELALTALSAYDLPPIRLTLLAHLFNTTFRVDTATGERYVLRINRAGMPSVRRVAAELAWLAALRRDTTLEVPSPVSTIDGSLFTIAATPHIPAGHICVLFQWLPGRILRRGLTPDHLRRVGSLMAHLHNHAAQWVSQGEHSITSARGRVDYLIETAKGLSDPFAPDVITYIHALVEETLSAAEATQVMEILERVKAVEDALGNGPDVFGLIHADLHYGNLLFAGDTLKAIDFDDCGFGPLLYDHAVMLNMILDWPGYPALRNALLSGYREVRLLSIEKEAYLNTFIALRRVQDAIWVLEW